MNLIIQNWYLCWLFECGEHCFTEQQVYHIPLLIKFCLRIARSIWTTIPLKALFHWFHLHPDMDLWSFDPTNSCEFINELCSFVWIVCGFKMIPFFHCSIIPQCHKIIMIMISFSYFFPTFFVPFGQHMRCNSHSVIYRLALMTILGNYVKPSIYEVYDEKWHFNRILKRIILNIWMCTGWENFLDFHQYGNQMAENLHLEEKKKKENKILNYHPLRFMATAYDP